MAQVWMERLSSNNAIFHKMVFDLNPANCNFPQSSTSSCTELFCEAASKCRPEQQCHCRSGHCQRCCLNSMINDHTYSVLKRICRKIIKDFNRQQCREKYTIFDGGNSVNVRIHRSASAGCNKTLTDSKYKLGAYDSNCSGDRASKYKKSFSSSAVGRFDDARDRRKHIGDAEAALKHLAKNRSRSSAIGRFDNARPLTKDRSRTSNRGAEKEHRKSRGRDDTRTKNRRKPDDDEHIESHQEKRKSKSKKRFENDDDDEKSKNKSKPKKGASSDDDEDKTANAKKKRKGKGASVDNLIIPDLRTKVRKGQDVAPASVIKKDDNRINELDKDFEKMSKSKQKRKSLSKDMLATQMDSEKDKGKGQGKAQGKDPNKKDIAPQVPPSNIKTPEKGTAKDQGLEKGAFITRANGLDRDVDTPRKDKGVTDKSVSRSNIVDKSIGTGKGDGIDKAHIKGRGSVSGSGKTGVLGPPLGQGSSVGRMNNNHGSGKTGVLGPPLGLGSSVGRMNNNHGSGKTGVLGPPLGLGSSVGRMNNNHGRGNSVGRAGGNLSARSKNGRSNVNGRSTSNMRGSHPNGYGGGSSNTNGKSGVGRGGGRFKDFDKRGVAGLLGRSMPNIRGGVPHKLTKSGKDRYNGIERYGAGKGNRNRYPQSASNIHGGRYFHRGISPSKSMHDRRSGRFIRPSRCDEARPCDYLRANMEQRELCEISTQRSGPSRYTTNSSYSGNEVCFTPCDVAPPTNTSYIC